MTGSLSGWIRRLQRIRRPHRRATFFRRRCGMESLEGRWVLATAVADMAVTPEDQAIEVDVLANDTGTGLTVTAVTSGAGGTATINGDGTVNFAPEADFSGDANFEYTIEDDAGDTDTATVTVTVEPVADAPTLDLNGVDLEGVDFSATFLAGGDPVALTSNMDLADVEGDIASVTVALDEVLDAGEETLAVNVGDTGLTAEYDPETGELTISGNGTPEDFAAVLSTLTYENTAEAPTEGERTISVAVTDAAGLTATATATVDVQLDEEERDPTDVNGDGKTNVADLLAVVRFLREHRSTEVNDENAAFDVNGDGIINIGDLVTLARNMRSNGHGGGNGQGGGHGNAPRLADDDGDDGNVGGNDDDDEDEDDSRGGQNSNSGRGRALGHAIAQIAPDVAAARRR